MINAIFFDLDGVLTTDAKGSLTMSRNLCEEVPRLSPQEVLACYRADIELLNLGERMFHDVWQRLCSTFNIPDDQKLQNDMLRKVPWNDAMLELARSLQSHFVLGIITDNCRERMDVLTAEMNLGDLFDPIVVSAIEHASKCDGTTRIFDAALDRAGCKAEETLFIDNQERNLTTPRNMGMHTYWHDDAKNDVAELRRALGDLGIETQSNSPQH
ncbi:MAG: HAD hydrolase-like protein [Candidatus Peregrinibacteria bacterium]|nr:HAD hydrolase-like protein [Candidatus Peregrinibacteria bacterium]